MAAPQNGQRIATAWENYVGTEPEDNIHETYWLVDKMQKNGGTKGVDGGRSVNAMLEYALNPNVAWQGETDTVATAVPDIIDEAVFSWKILGASVAHTEFEKAINQGGGTKTGLLAAKMENMNGSIDNALNAMLFGAASGNIPGGLTDIVAASPATGTIGGINRANFTFWRNVQVTGTKTTTAYDNLRSTTFQAYNSASAGMLGKRPKFAVTTQTVFQGYASLLVANERYVRESASDKGISGFSPGSLMNIDMEMNYDADCGSGLLYLLNFEFFKLAYPKGFWKKGYPAVDPANQFGDVFKQLTICVPITNNARKLAVVTAIT
jgi:hypothetical protein